MFKSFSKFINESFKEKETEIKNKLVSMMNSNLFNNIENILSRYTEYDDVENRIQLYVYPYNENNLNFIDFMSVKVDYMFFTKSDMVKYNVNPDMDYDYYKHMLRSSNNNVLKGSPISKYGKNELIVSYIIKYDLKNNEIIIVSDSLNSDFSKYKEVLFKINSNSINFDEILKGINQICNNYEKYLLNFIRKDAGSFKNWTK